MKFISDAIFPPRHGKSVNKNFPQYLSERNNNKLNCCLEIQSKMAARISVFTLHPFTITFKPSSSRGPVYPSIPTFPNVNLTKIIKNLLVILKINEKWLQ